MSVRVRYAPSPTGLQHIGGVRTALFNYFYAKSQGGKFILRVEDTDQERYSDESLQDLYDTFSWLDIKWDEGPDVGGDFGPYIQSERFAMYQKYANELVEKGFAYKCFCTSERLDELREEQQKEKKALGYDRHCRDLSEDEIKANEEKGLKYVIRFKIPLEGKTVVNDILLGDVKRKNKDISPDPILLKSDGFPTYHLANVIDDHYMKITHILRAQEWLPSGPLHVLLYNAFGWEPPKYCHLPMVMGKDGQKLSKRHGSTSLRDFIKEGYLPEAIINYVSMVGWAYDDSREFFKKEDLEKLFSLEKINKAPGVFDYKKLDWFNGQYIRQKSDEELKKLCIPYLIEDSIVSDPVKDEEMKIIDGMIPLIKERLRKLNEVSDLVSFLFKGTGDYDKELLVPKKSDAETSLKVLEFAKEKLPGFSARSEEVNEDIFKAYAEVNALGIGNVFMPIRAAVTGRPSSPPLFGSMSLLGEEEALKRIDKAIELLKQN